MRRIARLFAVIGSLMLVLAGCSDASSTSKGEVKVGGLEAAFAAAKETSSYRISQANGQTFKSSALGVNSTMRLDPDNPGLTGEVTPRGTHMTVQLAALTGALAPGVPDDAGFEIWSDDSRVVLDTRAYAALQKAKPEVALGPFRPGISSIDLSQIEAGDADLLAILAGQGLPDLEELATELPKVLTNVEQNGSVFTGTAKFGALVTAMGGNLDQFAKGAAAGIALNLNVDASDLAKLYVDYYKQQPADVRITVEDGVLRSVGFEVDLSDLFTYVFDHSSELSIDASAEDIANSRASFADTVFEVEALNTFTPVDGLKPPALPKNVEDRTDEWIKFLRAAGF